MDSDKKKLIRLPDHVVAYSDHVVAFIDVLGQREKLDRLKRLPDSEEGIKDFEEIADQTYGVVESLRNSLRENTDLCYSVYDSPAFLDQWIR